jgi:hypothetical protein
MAKLATMTAAELRRKYAELVIQQVRGWGPAGSNLAPLQLSQGSQ